MHTFYQIREHDFLCSISNNLTYPAHLHKQIEVVYVLSGNIKITINGLSKILLPGDISISYPNTIHSLRTIDSSKLLLIIFDIHLIDIDNNNLLNYLPSSPFHNTETLHKDVTNCLMSLMYMDKEKPDYTLIKAYLTIIFCYLQNNLELVEVMHNDLNLLQQALVYIDNHFTETITLNILAKQLNTSRFYVSRIFNTKLNTTFNFYLNDKRIKYAQNLLVSTELSITEIAYKSGFESTRTFYRAFNESCHLTPKEFRNNRQKLKFLP